VLGKIDQWLRQHRSRFHESILPGASPGDCEHLATTLGIRLPEDLHAWLTWHNGQNPDVPGALEQSWILMSVEEIIDAKKELDEEGHKGWEKHWLPLLDDDNGNYLCVDVATPHLPVLECWRGREDHPVISPTLAAWAHDFLTALEKGEYREDPERGTFMRRREPGHAEKTS
jgi:cell wall assembly regulator SMI1